MVEHLGEDGAVLVVEEPGDLKKGTITSQPWPGAPRRSRPSTPLVNMVAPTSGPHLPLPTTSRLTTMKITHHG
jgi:hypothetical protein